MPFKNINTLTFKRNKDMAFTGSIKRTTMDELYELNNSDKPQSEFIEEILQAGIRAMKQAECTTCNDCLCTYPSNQMHICN